MFSTHCPLYISNETTAECSLLKPSSFHFSFIDGNIFLTVIGFVARLMLQTIGSKSVLISSADIYGFRSTYGISADGSFHAAMKTISESLMILFSFHAAMMSLV